MYVTNGSGLIVNLNYEHWILFGHSINTVFLGTINSAYAKLVFLLYIQM